MRYILDFVGAQSVGKTTLINAVKYELEKKDYSVEVIPSASRRFFLDGEVENLYSGVNDIGQLMITLSNWTRILTSQATFVLCTDLGVRSYSYCLLSRNMSQKVIDLHRSLSEIMLKGLDGKGQGPLASWIYVPPEIPVEEDNVRETDEAERQHHDEIIRGILTDYRNMSESRIRRLGHICRIFGVTGSVQNRVERVLRYLVNLGVDI